MTQRYKHVVDGTIQIPLPDEPAARARAFGEVATAWSLFLAAIDHLLPLGAAAGGRLSGGVREAAPTPSAESVFARGYQQGLGEAEAIARAGSGDTGTNAAPAPVPVNGSGTEKPAAKANSAPRGSGSNHQAAHMAKMREAKAKRAAMAAAVPPKRQRGRPRLAR